MTMLRRRPATALLVCGLLVSVVGCKKLLNAATEEDDAADATAKSAPPPTVTASATGAPAAAKVTFANVADIARYPDEKAFDDDKASVHTNMLTRASVPSGAVVGTVLAGKPVTKIASHQGFVLVSFEDPKDPSRTLIGWMAQGGLSATAATATAATAVATAGSAPKAAPKGCPAGQISFIGLGCAVECPNDSDCKKVPGTSCVGGQFVEEPGGTNHIGRACMKTAGLPAPKKCKAGEILAADECALKCDMDKPKCPAGKKCDMARFRGETGDFQVEAICQ